MIAYLHVADPLDVARIVAGLVIAAHEVGIGALSRRQCAERKAVASQMPSVTALIVSDHVAAVRGPHCVADDVVANCSHQWFSFSVAGLVIRRLAIAVLFVLLSVEN